MGSGTVQMDTSGWGILQSFGVDAFPLHCCFCGWDGNGSFCLPLVEVANAIPEIAHGFPGQSRDIIALIKSSWVQGWQCPALQLGDQYGVMDSSQYNDWLTGVQRDCKICGMDLLCRGRSGLRVGSFVTLSSSLNQSVSPAESSRWTLGTLRPHHPVLRLRIWASLWITPAGCRYAPGLESQLFPVAQGAYESGTASYCLRNMIEAALLETLMMVSEQVGNGSVQIGLEIALQQKKVNLWRVLLPCSHSARIWTCCRCRRIARSSSTNAPFLLLLKVIMTYTRPQDAWCIPAAYFMIHAIVQASCVVPVCQSLMCLSLSVRHCLTSAISRSTPPWEDGRCVFQQRCLSLTLLTK